jgi:3-hydroxyisobutyrate dehydrogenase-like beta-hydroxyacid dehydrogenase
VRISVLGLGRMGQVLAARLLDVSPATTAELAAAFGTERFVALPVLGAPAAVRSGQAVYLAAGPPATIQQLEPVLTCLSDKVVRYPEAPLATAAKLTVNLVLLSGLVALAEAFAVGRAGGLSDDDLRALLGESPMVAPGLRNRFDGVLTGEHESWWTAALGAKDAGLAASLARSVDVEVPLAETVHERYEAVAALGLDDAGDDVAAIGRLYRPGR